MSDNQSSGGEFEREPVPEARLLGPGKFWGMYAGEHCAGTEFMIGPLFLGAGASLQDLIVGLLLGNLLAVLTWRYLVVPIAIAKRLTLYYQLERIAGGQLVKLYNVVNGVLFCFLAGAMVTVSASAIGVPFGVLYKAPPEIFGLGETSFTVLVLVVGAVMSLIAAAGYDTVARVANLAAPWMIVVFGAAGIVSLGQMEVDTWSKLSDGAFWSEGIDFVRQEFTEEREALISEGQALVTAATGTDGDPAQLARGNELIASGEAIRPPVFTFWQIVVFAWLCNGAMHFGMADLSIFRFARHASSGWAPAIGMLLGHYMAWIAAGLMLAAQIKLGAGSDPNPGLLAYNALGWAGILCVVIAGWTTANPTIYRAGLAFQGVFPRSSRVAMTLLAGGVATLAGIFPNLSAQLLGFVGAYGTVLGPMGAVIFVDYYLMRRFGLTEEYAAQQGLAANVAVLVAWLLPVAVGLYLIFWQGLFAAYAVVPCWLACGALYLLMSGALQRREQSVSA
ncbi:purine-cytosine permease family protein [Botrimarina hoheduenensis]|uniref:Cytosine permease n=1 Tax=Botrimarina hoheduenensis TaxID=2528000 RepID=A0A5C5VY06_9BACT|nr:hypothetical protein [Botrimarina hoheduenensis]TWT42885.1 cytosine permease [Botrimarina hoheduenensis]